MSDIKAIETSYKGFRFRSRLEARWAMFFDQIGVSWNYEVDPLSVDGEAYLPDFTVRLQEHDFIHEVKPESSQDLIQPRYVYLAGKVSPEYEWRGSAAVSTRNTRSGISDDELHARTWSAWIENARSATMENTSFMMVGPFPSSCDHGCAHGDDALHLAETCSGEDDPELAIAMACSGAIWRSEIFCAHIETGDAYGTLVEIGAALCSNPWVDREPRLICLTFDRELLSSHPKGHRHWDDETSTRGHDLWFAPALACVKRKENKSAMVEDRDEARRIHSRFIRDHTSREYRLISTIGQVRPAVMTFGDPLNVAKQEHAFHNFGTRTPLLPLLCRWHLDIAQAVRAHRFDGT